MVGRGQAVTFPRGFPLERNSGIDMIWMVVVNVGMGNTNASFIWVEGRVITAAHCCHNVPCVATRIPCGLAGHRCRACISVYGSAVALRVATDEGLGWERHRDTII